MWYPVTEDPPSSVGGCHDNLHRLLKMSLTTGAVGAPGTTVKGKAVDFIA